MARVTVEDCINRVSNRFDLVLLSAHRARAISAGSEIEVARDRDKNPVVALREIAEHAVDPADLRESLIASLQRQTLVDETEERRLIEEDRSENDISMSEEDLLRAMRANVESAKAAGQD